MSFNPLSAAFDAQSEMLDAAADVTRKSSIAPERAVEIETIDVGQTPSTVVYDENKLELLRYESMTDEQNEVPILIVYALINKPYILDLQADRSVVRRLLEAGHDVYMIDWNEPSRLDQHLGLDDYINRYIDNCVDAVRDRSGQDSINLLGYCMGGTMSTIYAALHREKVNALGLMAAGLCFDQTGGILEEWGSEEYYDPQDVVDAYGNVPAGLLDDGFALMDPVDNYFSKYITLYENLESDGFVENFARMERWLDEGIDLAGQAYVEFLQKIYQNNELYNNELEIGGEHVDVETIDMPVLQIVGEYDHLIPAEASKPFNDVVGSDDVTTIEYPTGHIGMSVSSSTHEDVWPQVCEWYHEHSDPEDAEADVESIQEQAQAEVAGDDADTDATASKATFEVYEDEAGQYRWRLVHRNGNIIANGGEGHASKQKAQQGLESVTANVAGARLVDETRDDGDEPAAGSSKATVELFEDADGKYRWRLVHDNGKLIADSGQGYASKQKAKQGLASVRTNAPATPVDSINGIGPTYAERLESAGIETTADLAEYGPAELAEIADTTESRVEDWLGQV